MARLGDSIRRHRGDVAVGEIDLRPIGYAIGNRVVAPPLEHVPADVRNLERESPAQSEATATQDTEPGAAGRLVAAFVQPLHAETDAEQRPSGANEGEDGLGPSGIDRGGRAEVTDAWHDDAMSAADRGG